MATPLSSAPSSPYSASTLASADGTPSMSGADTPTPAAAVNTTTPFPALTTSLTTPFRRFLGSPQDARSTPGVGRLRDYAFPVYDGESRRWFLLRVVDINEATARDIDSGEFAALEGVYGVLAAGVDASVAEAPPPAAAEGREVSEAATNNNTGITVTDETTSITISLTTGTITATSSALNDDVTPGTYYAPLEAYNLPKPPKKAPAPAPTDNSAQDNNDNNNPPTEPPKSPVTPVSRYGLLEISRLAPRVDLVAPVWNPAERLVFMHYDSDPSAAWSAVQFPLHLAPLTNGVVPIRNLVTHERTRDARSGRVVGFTVPYYAGGSLGASRRERPFKLAWARGLFELVDELNLELGVVHGGIRAGRVFVDEEGGEERVVLGSFGQARKRVPGEGSGATSPADAGLEEFNDLYYDEDEKGGGAGDAAAGKLETDVIAAVLLVHDLVTRDPDDNKWMAKQDYLFSGVGLDAILKGPWRAHHKASLDSGPEEYRAAVVEWLDKREKDPRVKNGAKDLGFKEKMVAPGEEMVDVEEHEDPLGGEKLTKVAVTGERFYRRDAIKHGEPVVEWVRPVTGKVEEGRKLLVTGHYARTEEEKKKNDLKRRLDAEERGRGTKRARGRGRHRSRDDSGEWTNRAHSEPKNSEGRGEGRGRGRRDHILGNYRVTKPDGEGQRGYDGPKPPLRGRPGRGGRGAGDRRREGRSREGWSREGTVERSGSNDSRRRAGRRNDGGPGARGDGRGHSQGGDRGPSKTGGGVLEAGGA